MKSILPIFKIGIGPSSSHTVGPMLIGKAFCEDIEKSKILNDITNISIDLYGSLSLTGKGHLVDIAIMLGLSGFIPESITTQMIGETINTISKNKKLNLNKTKIIPFNKDTNIIFNSSFLKLHENGVILKAFKNKALLLEKTYYSIGGGFITEAENFHKNKSKYQDNNLAINFNSATELLDLCKKYNKKISEIALMRELQVNTKEYINNYYKKVWDTMYSCMQNGLQAEGILPGGLRVPRRAKYLNQQLQNDTNAKNDDFYVINWISAHAIAVSEENAAGHKVVTAPTNGACAVNPAVMAYYNHFHELLNEHTITQYLITASAIGYLYKTNASISGAEAGCQAEVGAASSMAAVAIAELLGATAEQCCIAGEIAMEHHLGLTCDPIGGLVQIPCIERNAFGAVKAIMAAKMALNRKSKPIVSLDNVIKAMYDTGKDMNHKYKETSLGGLASIIKPCD